MNLLAFDFIETISSRVDETSATEPIDLGSIPSRAKPETIKLVFTTSLLDVQKLMEQCEASQSCKYGRVSCFLS